MQPHMHTHTQTSISPDKVSLEQALQSAKQSAYRWNHISCRAPVFLLYIRHQLVFLCVSKQCENTQHVHPSFLFCKQPL